MARVKSKTVERPLLKRKVGRPKGSKNKKAAEPAESKAAKETKKSKKAKVAEEVSDQDKVHMIIRLEADFKEAYRLACEENMRSMSQQTIYLIHSFLRAENKRKREEEG